VTNLSSTALTASSSLEVGAPHWTLLLYWVNPRAVSPPARRMGMAAFAPRGTDLVDVVRHLTPAERMEDPAIRRAALENNILTMGRSWVV